MYLIFTEQHGITYFWRGKGIFTRNHDLAKTYPTWEQANKACYRIKRWPMKFMSVEDWRNLGES